MVEYEYDNNLITWSYFNLVHGAERLSFTSNIYLSRGAVVSLPGPVNWISQILQKRSP